MSRRPIVLLVGLAVVAAFAIGIARLTGGDGAKAHPLGTKVVVGHVDASEGDPGVRTQIGLTVLAVRRGTQEELAANGLEVDAEDRDTTPYYIDARFANEGDNAVARNLDVGLEDSDGNLVPRTVVFAAGNVELDPCREIREGTLRPGQSYESCTLVLVPEGVEAEKVYFLSDKGPDTPPEFVYWATE